MALGNTLHYPFPTRPIPPSLYLHQETKDEKSSPRTLSDLPQEVLLEICKSLDQKDSKSVRQLCGSLSQAGLDGVFSHVVLQSNMDSLTRLYQLSSQPELAAKVKTLSYRGMMLDTTYNNKMPRSWYEGLIGRGFGLTGSSAMRRVSRTLSIHQLHYHYRRFRHHCHSQESWIKNFAFVREYLSVALENLPNLENLHFDSGLLPGFVFDSKVYVYPVSQIGRESLIEPNALAGVNFHDRQAFTLLWAASYTGRALKVIDLKGVPWKVLDYWSVPFPLIPLVT